MFDPISAAPRLARRLFPTSNPARVALGLALVQWLVLSVLVHRQISGIGSNSWDLGIFNQALYDMARGRSFMTYRGMDVFGHHFHPAFYVLAPVSWFGGGARALSLIQVAMLCVGTWPAFLLGRDRVSVNGGPNPTAGLLIATIYLLHPLVTGLSWWMFHPESLAIAAVLTAWWAATTQRWKLFAFTALWAVLSREDIALAVAGLGVSLAFVFRQDRRARKIGVLTAVAALGYWSLVTQVVMPARLGTREPYYVQDFWGHLGSTMPEVLVTAVTHPNRALAGVKGQDGAAFAATLIGPTGGLAFMNPVTLVGAGPQFVAVTLSNDPDSRQPWHHHSAIVMPFTIISAAEALRRIVKKRPRLFRLLATWMIVSAGFSYLAMAPTPLGPLGNRWAGTTKQSIEMQRAVRTIPRNAAVAATVRPGNLLTNRPVIYTWPNPFKKWKRGYEFSPLPPVESVDYLVVLRNELGMNAPLFADLTSKTGMFRVLSDVNGVVVAERR